MTGWEPRGAAYQASVHSAKDKYRCVLYTNEVFVLQDKYRTSTGGRRSTGVEGQVVHFHVAVPIRRVYHHDNDVKKATCRLWKTGGPAPQDPAHNTVTVTLYQINNLSRRRRRRKQDVVLMQALNVSVTGDEWLTVNVTEAVREWLKTPRDDAGVLVQCPDCGAAGVTIHTGVNTSNTTYVPTLDVQTQVPAGRRVKRSPELTRATKAKWRRHGDCRDMSPNGRRRRSRCCRRSMKVRFKDLPDFDFVESPDNFDAFYCSGKCPPRFNPANEHALLQSLLKLKHKKRIPRPCCAPTALKGLHILHLNDQGTLTTTYWDDMIVTECGCA
ncbi:Protein 60A-like 1 [Homarus americanus]|uniref:Protein 60A-like 1 n=1 Tax=Homarus americanus TaxID=6706 RepID=A0A8J5JXJ7_HOMAM|nr:Protein 60A-like 1 [Homarus americanus]